MKRFLSLIIFFIAINSLVAQSMVTGIVVTENGLRMPNVIVLNVATDERVKTNEIGEFKIKSSYGQPLRFVKEHYERTSWTTDARTYLEVVLVKSAQEIDEVEISRLKLTGDVKDANQITIDDPNERLRQNIGLPKSPEKPRERAPEVKDVLLPLIFAQLNVDAVYKLVSGKAKQMKRQYRYDDQQDRIQWMRANIGDDYLVRSGIPVDFINAFLLYSLSDEDVLRYVKAKNTSGVMISMEKLLPEFIQRLTDLKQSN